MKSLIVNLASGILVLLVGTLVSPEVLKKYWYIFLFAVIALLFLSILFRRNEKIVQSNIKSPIENGTWDLGVNNVKIERNSYEFFGNFVIIKAKFTFPFGIGFPDKIDVSLPYVPDENKNVYISINRNKFPVKIRRGVPHISIPVAGNATVHLETEYTTRI